MPASPINPNDPGRGPVIIGITWTLTLLAITAVALRFYVRKRRADGWVWWDDWLMLLAVVFQTAQQAIVTVSYHHGLGKHDADVTREQLIQLRMWRWISIPPGFIVSILSRVSIAILLVRLFGVRLWFKWFIITTTVLSTTLCIVLIPMSFVRYSPVQKLWNPYIKNYHDRIDPMVVTSIEYTVSALFTFTDFAFAVFPVAIIWRLNMRRRQKIGLIILVGVSFFTVVASLFKTIWINITLNWYSGVPVDINYNAALLVLWSGLEQCIVIILGCIPSLRALGSIDFPGFNSLASSLSGMIRSNRSRRPSEGKGVDDTGKYIEKERGAEIARAYYHTGT